MNAKIEKSGQFDTISESFRLCFKRNINFALELNMKNNEKTT
jgi:hypothetical protein